jgi:hypothetical protein
LLGVFAHDRWIHLEQADTGFGGANVVLRIPEGGDDGNVQRIQKTHQ